MITEIKHEHDESGDVSRIHVSYDDNTCKIMSKKEFCELMGISIKDYNKKVVTPFRKVNKK